MQLRARSRGFRVACGLVLSAALASVTQPARAEAGSVETSHSLYHEAPTRSNMTVYTPALDVSAVPASWLTVRGGYGADVVSGASVAVKAGPAYQSANPGADVVTTASVRDLRHTPHGSVVLRKDDVSLTAGYTYGTENDYRSHSAFVAARTEAYDHNTQLELSYARNFDLVCDRVQGVNDAPPRHRALESSTGCFTGDDPLRTRHKVAVDGFQASWSQAWTPTLLTQLVYTAQMVNGFQSNPYRSVIVAQGLKAQEHHPGTRTRQAVGLRANLYLRPIKTALRAGVRGYTDTWDVRSATVDLEAERYFAEPFRAALRVRGYRQSGALFWSDDYTGGDAPLGPQGQYFTGDRELSPFTSGLLGLRGTYLWQLGGGRRILGLFESIKVSEEVDVIQFSYDEYTLGGAPLRNARAYIGTLSASAVF